MTQEVRKDDDEIAPVQEQLTKGQVRQVKEMLGWFNNASRTVRFLFRLFLLIGSLAAAGTAIRLFYGSWTGKP